MLVTFENVDFESLIPDIAKMAMDSFIDNKYEILDYPRFRSLPVAIMDVVYSLHQDYSRSEKITARYVNSIIEYATDENCVEFNEIITDKRFEFNGGLQEFFQKIYDCSKEDKANLVKQEKLSSTDVMAMSLKDFAVRERTQSEEFWKKLEDPENKKINFQSSRLMRSKRGRGDAVEEIALIFYKLGWEKNADKVTFDEKLVNEEADEVLIHRLVDSVHGIGDNGARYVLMLLGYTGYCKPDSHIKGFFNESLKGDLKDKVKKLFESRNNFNAENLFSYVKNEDIQKIMERMVALMTEKYKGLTVRQLDYSIWDGHRKRGASKTSAS